MMKKHYRKDKNKENKKSQKITKKINLLYLTGLRKARRTNMKERCRFVKKEPKELENRSNLLKINFKRQENKLLKNIDRYQN